MDENFETPSASVSVEDPIALKKNISSEIERELSKNLSKSDLDVVFNKITDHLIENSFKSSTEAISDFIKQESFQGLSEDSKKGIGATLESLQNAENLKSGAPEVAQNSPKAAQDAPDSSAKSSFAPDPSPKKMNGTDRDEDGNKKEMTAEEKEAYRQMLQQQQYAANAASRPVTAGGMLLSALAAGVTKAFKGKEQPPGQSFTDLKNSGFGFGMNAMNQDPAYLSNVALDRLDKEVNTLSKLKADANPELIAKAKAGVLEASGDVERYLGSENRSLMSQMAEGKLNEFDARDTMSARSNRLKDAMGKAEKSDVSEFDPDFKSKIKETAEKALESINQLMESLKEMAKKFFGQDKEAGPSSPGPGR